MKRIANLAAIAAVIAFGLCQSGVFAQSAAGYCPPGAKFCPTSGYDAPLADSGFGMGDYAMQTPPANDAYFQSQLNEGEQLIMVAPGGDFANVPASGQPAYTPPASYAPPANLYAAPSPMPTSLPMDNGGYAGGFAAAPASMTTPYAHEGPAEGLRGFIPPLPGSQPSQSSYPSYENSGPAMGYAPTPASAPAIAYSPVPEPMASGPAPLTAAPFRTPYPQSLTPAPIPAQAQQRPLPEYGETAAAPRQERTHPYQNVTSDQKKRRAEMLSEVANETSRRPDKIDLKPRNENRKPWWKGGFWNHKSESASAGKSRAEIKAERNEAKLAARKAKEDAKRAKN